MNRKILLLGLSVILLILPISTSTSVWAQPMNPPPMVAGITPSSGEQGQTLDLIISGHYFQDGASVSFSPPIGITINSLPIISPMELRVNITIDPNAPAVPKDVTVTNPDAQYATLEGGFTVKAKGCTDLYLAYVKAQQAADEACLTYDLLKLDAKRKINDAQKAVEDKQKALKDCQDKAEAEKKKLEEEKGKLEKEIDQLKKQIEGIKGKIPGLEREEKLWFDLMQETAFEAGTELTAGVGIGVAKGILIVAGIATGPVGLAVLIIGGGLEIWSAAHTRSNLNYYTEQYNNAFRALNEANTQILQLDKQLASKQAELASLSEKITELEKACETEKGELDKANADFEVLNANLKAAVEKAEKECNEATEKKREAEAKYEECLKALTAE